jgi:hypothetical protein
LKKLLAFFPFPFNFLVKAPPHGGALFLLRGSLLPQTQVIYVVSLCKNCVYRFRRIFIPAEIDADDDSVIIMLHCLISNMDIAGEETIDCSNFKEVLDGSEEKK